MKIDIKLIIILLLTFLVANPSLSTPVRFIVFFVMLLCALRRDELLIFILGISNVIPFFWDFSPMQFIVLIMSLKVISLIYIKKASLLGIFMIREVFIAALLLLWLFVCALWNDFMVLIPYVLGIITMVVLIITFTYGKVDYMRATKYYLMGMGQMVVISYLSVFNIMGYIDTGLNRLTLTRGDANSIALGYGFIAVFLLTFIINKIKAHVFRSKDILLIFGFIAVINIMLITGSRGTFISLLLTMVVFIMFYIFDLVRSKEFKFKKNGLLYLSILSFLLLFSTIIYYFYSNLINAYFIEKYSVLFTRLTENDDGLLQGDIRYYLYKQAIELALINPTFGIGMENFMNITTKFPHNTYLDYLTAGGVLGFTLYILLLIHILISTNYKGNIIIYSFYMSVVFILINSATYSAIGDKIFWVSFGFLILNKRMNGKKETKN